MLVDIFSSLDYYSNSGSEVFQMGCSYFGIFAGGLVFWSPYQFKFWVAESGLSLVLVRVLSVVFGIVEDCNGGRFGGFSLGYASIFLTIFCLNISGMVPGSFSVTSQLSVGVFFGLVWWLWSVMSGFFLSCKKSLGHLLPIGTPWVLCPIMILIETVSLLIRPITLSVRLVANMTMGHLVLSLMGDKMIGLGSLVVGGYVLFEFFVCSLQAYVFTLLVSLYSSDHPDCSYGN
uniref:ATP synthase subunit a n=1 Tax=Venustaconcha ellipsiformis TaxID=301928 RepID=D2DW15_VENEL|nr:ATP synthase F0 subunit 6 [Venustaconcha ellipsiformis]ACQ91030.1 ATP synthase F0 subunit 6 [Venustaconcha ellipsiformis]